MGKKKRHHPDIEEILGRPWCYYCERDFDDLKILISHQKAKHFKCERCGRRLNTAGGLSVHMSQVHKEQLTAVDNALPHRQGLEVEIFGMEGIPEDVVQNHNQRVLQQYFEAQAKRQVTTGNPAPGMGSHNNVKKPKFESPEDIKKRLAEHRAKIAAGECESTTPEAPISNVTVSSVPMTSYPGLVPVSTYPATQSLVAPPGPIRPDFTPSYSPQGSIHTPYTPAYSAPGVYGVQSPVAPPTMYAGQTTFVGGYPTPFLPSAQFATHGTNYQGAGTANTGGMHGYSGPFRNSNQHVPSMLIPGSNPSTNLPISSSSSLSCTLVVGSSAPMSIPSVIKATPPGGSAISNNNITTNGLMTNATAMSSESDMNKLNGATSSASFANISSQPATAVVAITAAAMPSPSFINSVSMANLPNLSDIAGLPDTGYLSSRLNDQVISAATEASVDELIASAEREADAAAAAAAAATTTSPESFANPSNVDNVANQTSKKRKEKTFRLVYADNELSPEEKMASLPRYAYTSQLCNSGLVLAV